MGQLEPICRSMSGWAMLSTSARRAEASFCSPGQRPVVLLSAGIGATPVLTILHALAAARSTRQVLWLHAARDRQHLPFAAEVRRLMRALTHGRSYVCYSRPGSREKIGEDFNATGHLSRSMFDEVGIPREPASYLPVPTPFMAALNEHPPPFRAPP